MKRMDKLEKLDKAAQDYCVAAIEAFYDALTHAPNERAACAMLTTLFALLDAKGLPPEVVLSAYRKIHLESKKGGLS